MAVVDLWTRPEMVGGKVRKVHTDQWGTGKRWMVRWRDGDDMQRKRRFTTRDEAEAFWAELQMSPRERASGRTVREQYAVWIESKASLRESSRADYEQKWRNHVEPQWGDRRIRTLEHGEIAAWVGRVATKTSPTTARRAYVVLSGVVGMALRDGVISADPCAGVTVPRQPGREPVTLTVEQVRRLADECAPHGLMVWTLALTGIRWGELAGLDHADVDRARRRLRISKAYADGRLGATKSGRARDVPVPVWLLDQIPPGEGPVFVTQRGERWRQSSWKRIWSGPDRETPGARDRAGLPGLRVHDLRHVAATWAIQSGADVKVVQKMLGHSSATLTLDTYSHLFDQGLDDVAERMGRLLD